MPLHSHPRLLQIEQTCITSMHYYLDLWGVFHIVAVSDTVMVTVARALVKGSIVI